MTPAGVDAAPGPWARALARYREHRRQAAHITLDAFQVASALLLLALVVHPPPETSPLARVVLAVGLVVPAVSRRYATFWVVAFVLFLSSPLERTWLTLDNHEVLQVYWLGAFALSRFADRPMQTLRVTARWTLALVFLFATAWKLLSPDFLDGSAVEFLFATEPRVADVAVVLGLQEGDQLEDNWTSLAAWHDPTRPVREVDLGVGEVVPRVSVAVAWLTVLLEGAVAVAFLLPLPPRRRWWRDLVLLAFVLATYPIAPVLPFAWLLLSLGAMQSTLPARTRNRAYTVTFLIVTFVFGGRSWALFPMLEQLVGS